MMPPIAKPNSHELGPGKPKIPRRPSCLAGFPEIPATNRILSFARMRWLGGFERITKFTRRILYSGCADLYANGLTNNMISCQLCLGKPTVQKCMRPLLNVFVRVATAKGMEDSVCGGIAWAQMINTIVIPAMYKTLLHQCQRATKASQLGEIW